MTKGEWRRAAKLVRDAAFAACSPAERARAGVLLAGLVAERIADAGVVAVYLPIGSEIDTLALIDRIAGAGQTLALPHVAGRRDTMRFLHWVPGDPLPAGPMGLRQPDAAAPAIIPDVVLVPLLAFDARGHRLGYGAGHYDRALAVLPRARRIGLAWSVQRVEHLPDDAWDVPLHAIATPTDWIEP